MNHHESPLSTFEICPQKWHCVGLMTGATGMFNGAERAPLGARICSTREPAKFNDGMMDM